MQSVNRGAEEIAARGRAIYDEKIRAVVEPAHRGEFVILDIETGNFEIDRDEVAAIKRAMDKYPGARFYIVRVGFPAAHRLGGRFAVSAR